MGTRNTDFDEAGINRRFSQLRQKLEGPRGKLRFAKAIGESHSNISRYEGTRTIPGHVIARAVQVYGANPEWILLGRGPMMQPTTADEIRELEITLPSDEDQQRQLKGERAKFSDFYVLPLLRDPTAAGPGRRITDGDVEGPAIIHKAWCPNPNRTDYVRVKGDSMEPGIPDESIVTIDKTYQNPEDLLGSVVAVYLAESEEVTIRRLQKDAVQPECYVGVPDNPSNRNRPVVLGRDDRIVGKVVSIHSLVR